MKERSRIFKRFKKNNLAVAGLVFIVLCFIAGTFAVLISPDKSKNANAIYLSLTAKPPGFSMEFLKVPKSDVPRNTISDRLFTGVTEEYDLLPVYSWKLEGDTVVYEEYLGDETPGDRKVMNVSRFGFSGGEETFEKEHIVKRTFWLGTDRFGRDMLSRMLLGTRVSLSVGFIAVIISLIIGIFLGALAGYYKGWVDNCVMWLINVIWSLPTLLLVIAFSLALGKGFWQVFIAVGLSMWVDVARLVRGQVMSLREKEFVEASKVLGMGDARILFRHILPNITGPLTVIAAANFASAILLEAGLSFLGLGVQPPAPSWGQMIKEHYGYIVLDSAYLAIVPGIAIMLLVMAFNFAGNGLRDALDVKMK